MKAEHLPEAARITKRLTEIDLLLGRHIDRVQMELTGGGSAGVWHTLGSRPIIMRLHDMWKTELRAERADLIRRANQIDLRGLS